MFPTFTANFFERTSRPVFEFVRLLRTIRSIGGRDRKTGCSSLMSETLENRFRKYVGNSDHSYGNPLRTKVSQFWTVLLQKVFFVCIFWALVTKNFLFFSDIETDSELQFYCLITQIFEEILRKYSSNLSQSHWDLILCSATSWLIVRIGKLPENY